MKIDHEYLKGLLEAFDAAVNHQTNIKELRLCGFCYLTDEFLFHMFLLDDLNIIARTDGKEGFGYSELYDDEGCWIVTGLRLTARGHDFLEAIRDKEVWHQIKFGFHEASIGTLIDVSKRLFADVVQNKINNILEGNI